MLARDDIQAVAAALKRPRAGYVEQIVRARMAAAGRSGEAARQLEVFVDRIGDLTIDEIRELHDETFRRGSLTEIGPVAVCLVRRPASAADARAALNVLAPALDQLEGNRNPFAYVVRALCCLLMARSNPSRMEQKSL